MQESVAIPLAPIESRYRPLLELGRGGTARVFLAESLTSGLRKLVVLKTLEPELSMDAEMRALFRREAEVCARLNHPNIVQVHEVVEQVTGPVIVMEYLEGIALSQVIAKSQGRFPKRLHLHAITQLLSGLHYFHKLRDYDRTTALNPIHRDVSPHNVVVLYEGAVKVLDFGIAKLANEEHATQTGVVKGKLRYMPAEQLLSDMKIDCRADIFSAGVMLWEALAGRPMWHGMSDNTVLQSLVRGSLPSLREATPGLPEHFYEIVARSTACDPTGRYATALDMQIDVERILTELGGQVHPRELAEFMRVEFEAWRQKQEAAIEEAIKKPTTRISLSASVETAGEIRQDSQSKKTQIGISEVREAQPAPRRMGSLILLGMVIVAVAAVLLVKKRSEAVPVVEPSAPQALPAPDVVNFAISSNPSGALILLDGVALGRSPWSGALPAKKATASLELRAENFEPVIKTVSLSEDFNVDVHLQPLPQAASSSAASSDEVNSKKTAGRGRVRQARAPSPAPSAKPAGNASPASNPNCNPPYTLSGDGIRTYKAECF